MKVGNVQKTGEKLIIHREAYGQGYVFKDDDAYAHHKSQPCYVPELSDTVYTGDDILKMCNWQKDFADELFEALDWQHPESLMEDWICNNEWIRCCKCGRWINYGDGSNEKKCACCGWEVPE